MKRSEMVTYLTKLLNTYEDCQLSETEANEILEGLEHMGIQPPKFQIKKMGYGCLCTMHEGCAECDQYGKYFKNEWEQE